MRLRWVFGANQDFLETPNRYAYVSGNVVNAVDLNGNQQTAPSGSCPQDHVWIHVEPGAPFQSYYECVPISSIDPDSLPQADSTEASDAIEYYITNETDSVFLSDLVDGNGYIEGWSSGVGGIIVTGQAGREIVYNFAAFERAEFAFGGVGIVNPVATSGWQ